MPSPKMIWKQGPNENALHCPPGKLYNPVSKRCKTRRAPSLRDICPPGKVLDKKTRRFRKERVLKPSDVCPPGKYYNKQTHRFRTAQSKNSKKSKSKSKK